MSISFTFDVEPDLHTGGYHGVYEGIPKIEKILKKYSIKAIFFVSCDCLEKYPKLFQKLEREGHEVALHGYKHVRFDNLPTREKEEHLKKAIICFKKYLNHPPRGFRAPQHSTDKSTLDLLEKKGFQYDSSYTPLNLLQLMFFPRKLSFWAKGFLSPTNPYKIRKHLVERPISSILIPPVSLIVRIFPKSFLEIYFKLLKILFKEPIFYAHSWDFVKLKDSRIDRLFSHSNFIYKFEELIKNENLRTN